MTCPILRYHPAIIAQASATLSNFAPGRTYLAVGTGEALNEYPTTGLWPDYSQRQDMLLEAISLIRALWTGKEITHDGVYYQTRKAKLYTPPRGNIPLYISSLVPESSAFAGKYGDGLITSAGNPPEYYANIIKNFESGAKIAGKDPSSLPHLIEIRVAYTDDKDAAINCVKKYWAGAFVPAMFNQNIYTPRMSEMNGAVVGNDTIEKLMCISGNPEDHVKFVQKFIDIGFTHIYFHTASPDMGNFIKSYAKDVLPKIRDNNK